ncbi:unnamed protein product, partial [Rotaria sordida]
MINIHFTNHNRNYLAQLPQSFNLNDLQRLIIRYFKNPFRYRFVTAGKELDLFNNESFVHYQSLFHNGANILVLERMRGGGYVEIEILTNIILSDLEQALQQIATINDLERPCQ